MCSLGCGGDTKVAPAGNDPSKAVEPPEPAAPAAAEDPKTPSDPVLADIVFATCSTSGVLTVAVQFTQHGEQQAYLYLPDTSFGCGLGGDLRASLDDEKLVLDLCYYPRRVPPAVSESSGPRRMQAVRIGSGNDVRLLTYTFCLPLTVGDDWHVLDVPDGEIPIQLVFGYGTEHPNEFSRPIEGPHNVAVQQKWVEWQHRLTTRPFVVKIQTKKSVK
jgi:hypothetical protein